MKEEHMELRTLGRSNVKVSAIIMGTWQAGREMWVGIDDQEITRAIRAAVDAGITTFDTAEAYGKGHSEKVLGTAVAGMRDRVVLATKVFCNHLKSDQVIEACHRSLKNLKTDYVDLYQIHWPAGSFGSKTVPISETMEALSKLKEQGKIRTIGVSNFSRIQLQEAAAFGRIDSLQPSYSLFWRHFETDAMSYCLENQVTVLAYSPMAQGLLTGKFGPNPDLEPGDHRAKNKLFHPENMHRVQRALAGLRPLAVKKGVNLGQLALAWVVSHPGVCAIAGARSAEQIVQTAQAADISLSADDLTRMDAAGRLVTDSLDDNPVMWNF
jgi:aryl-alcohol dehydrogenase-like predicted oxidoreductase